MPSKWLIFAIAVFVIGLILNLVPQSIDLPVVGNPPAQPVVVSAVADGAGELEEISSDPVPIASPTEIAPMEVEAEPIAEKQAPPALAEVQPEKIIKSEPKLESKFYRTIKKCSAFKQPDSSSATITQIAANKKVWVDGYDSQWGKIHLKAGEAYLSKTCLK